MLRILFTAVGRKVGGATIAMFNLMSGLSRIGHQPVLVTSNPSEQYETFFSRLEDLGVEIHKIGAAQSGFIHWVRLVKYVLTEIRSLNVDLAHLHLPKEAAFIFSILKSRRIPIISTFEGDPFFEMLYEPHINRGLVVKIGSHLMAKADAVTACSEWLAKRLEKMVGIGVYAVPNAIDAERFLDIGEWREREKIILALARLVPIKGIDVLIKAAHIVYSRCKEARFVVAGEGYLAQQLNSLIKKLGLEGVVKLIGFHSSPEKLLIKAYLLVMPSLYEPFGMPAAEAGAALRPVVASRTGGLAEIVLDGVNGLLANPGDPVDLAGKIIWLLENEEKAKEMARRGRARVLELYSPVTVARKYLEIYRLALKEL